MEMKKKKQNFIPFLKIFLSHIKMSFFLSLLCTTLLIYLVPMCRFWVLHLAYICDYIYIYIQPCSKRGPIFRFWPWPNPNRVDWCRTFVECSNDILLNISWFHISSNKEKWHMRIATSPFSYMSLRDTSFFSSFFGLKLYGFKSKLSIKLSM